MESSLDAVTKLLGLSLNKSSTTGGTSGKTLTAEQIQALIKRTLEGTQGLAATTSGERQAGLYNSSVNTQLTNDLLTRAAGEAAAQSTATTTQQTTTTPRALNPFKALGLMTLLDKDTRNAAKEGASALWDMLGSAPDLGGSAADIGYTFDVAGLASSEGVDEAGNLLNFASSADTASFLPDITNAFDIGSATTEGVAAGAGSSLADFFSGFSW